MISADDSPANIKRAYDLGAFDYISRPFDSTIVQRRISNTMFLYARQQRLEEIIAEQFYEQEKNNKLMIAILSHIVEFRNGESGLHILHVNTITKYLLKQLVQRTDKYPLSKSDITLIHVELSGKLFLTIKCFTHFLSQPINSAKPHLSSGEFEGGLVTLRLGKFAL